MLQSTRKKSFRWFKWSGDWEQFIEQTIAKINSKKTERSIQQVRDANYITKGLQRPRVVDRNSKEVIFIKYGAKFDRYYFNKFRAICFHDENKIGDEINLLLKLHIDKHEEEHGSILPIPKNEKVPQFV